MAFKQVWHATLQMGKREELVRALRDEVIPMLRRNPDFMGCRLFMRRFGPDFGFQVEFEYRTAAAAAQLMLEPEVMQLMASSVASLLSSNRADLLMEVDL